MKFNFISGQEKGILRKIKKENPETDIEELKNKINWSTPNDTKIIFFDNGFSLISGTKAMRTVCKIATNYYVHIKNEVKEIQEVIPFIKGENEGIGILKYYYLPEENLNYGEEEISHIIHLEGNKNEKLLLAYIELFNCYNYLIVLNYDYNGDDFEDTYCYDLRLNKTINKEIRLNLAKNDIGYLDFPQDADSEENFQKRLKRILNIRESNLK